MNYSDIIHKELGEIYNGDYNHNHEWEYTLASQEIVKRFFALFQYWDKIDADLKEMLLERAVFNINSDFCYENETIIYSLKNLHLEPIKNAVIENIESDYLTTLLALEISKEKSKYTMLIDLIKANLEKGKYQFSSIKIAGLLNIQIKPSQRI
jgi:hypothetical protein